MEAGLVEWSRIVCQFDGGQLFDSVGVALVGGDVGGDDYIGGRVADDYDGGGDGDDGIGGGDGDHDVDVGGGDGEGSLSVALSPLFSQTASTQELDREDDDLKSAKLEKRW